MALQHFAWATAAAGSVIAAGVVGQPGRSGEAALNNAVSDALQQAFPNAVIEEVEVEYEHGLTLYEVELFHDGRELEVEVTADGTILEVETETRQALLPEAVRQHVGDMPVHRVEKVEVRAELQPVALDQPRTVYVVESRGDRGRVEMRIDEAGNMLSTQRQAPPPPHMRGPGGPGGPGGPERPGEERNRFDDRRGGPPPHARGEDGPGHPRHHPDDRPGHRHDD